MKRALFMIIQTGQRTDIPAFYSEWFYNRIKEGFVLVRNPYNPLQVTKYLLNPQLVDLICFCSKNPEPMLKDIRLLKDFGMFWYVTITAYEKDMEPNVPKKEKVIENFIALSEIVGKNSMGWRYDPIIINDKYTVAYHLKEFEKMASEMSGYTDICVISFVDLYSKVRINAPEIAHVGRNDKLLLGKEMVSIAKDFGISVRPCGEGDFLSEFGADCRGCMTKDIYEKALGKSLNMPKFKPQRKECACYLSADIGAYNSCMHLCHYCYANYDAESVKNNYAKHDKNSPFLIGSHIDGEAVHDAKQVSWVDGQLKFDI